MPNLRPLHARTDCRGLGVSFERLRDCAGLAAAIVPCAILVHLVAEAAAIGGAGLSGDFVIRHEYFGVLFLAAASWFGATLGLGRPVSERRRRCALLRAELGGTRHPWNLTLLVGANLAFFTVTQAVEGVPIASADGVGAGLALALAGSLLSALLIYVFGHAVVAAGLDAIIGVSPVRRAVRTYPQRNGSIRMSRNAMLAYSLCMPNRPPPTLSHI